jgi:hypothetical protein
VLAEPAVDRNDALVLVFIVTCGRRAVAESEETCKGW